MKPLFLFFTSLFFVASYAQFNYEKTWSTYYLGASSQENAAVLDGNQNSIVVGIIRPYIYDTFPSQFEPSSYYDQWATFGCYQPIFAVTGNSAVESEGYVSKFSPNGEVLWSTYFGGANSDYVTDVAVDSQDNIYIVGITNSPSGIATAASYISDFAVLTPTDPEPLLHNYRGFLAKFSPTGGMQWCTYLPTDVLIYPLKAIVVSVTSDDKIFVAGATIESNTVFISTSGAFQETFVTDTNPNTLDRNGYVLKFDAQGNRMAGTLCGNGFYPYDVTTDIDGNLLVVGSTIATDYPLSTLGCYQPTSNGGQEGFILKLTSDLSTRIWGTYYGDTADDYVGLVTTIGTDIYVCGRTGQVTTGLLSSSGAFSETPSRGYLARFTGDGSRVWSTYLPFIPFVGPNYMYSIMANNNKLYIAGSTKATTDVSTMGAYQMNYASTSSSSDSDGFMMQFTTDGARNWGSYFGGGNRDSIANISIVDDNTFYVSGTTASASTISTPNSLQPDINYGSAPSVSATSVLNTTNIFLARFSNPLSTPSFSRTNVQLTPNPSNGAFVLSGNLHSGYDNLQVVLYDSLGKEVAQQDLLPMQNELHQSFDFSNRLSQGIYFAKLSAGQEVLQTFKVVIN